MKNDNKNQSEQQNTRTDNGWKPRMKAHQGAEDKEYILGLQQELMMKMYPTRESRSKEHEAGASYEVGSSAGTFSGTRDDYEGDSIAEVEENTFSEPDPSGYAGEAYTRLAKPKEKNEASNAPKHVYRKMPGSEQEEPRVERQEKKSGLGRAYYSGDDESQEMETVAERPVTPAPQQKKEEDVQQLNVRAALDRLFAKTEQEDAFVEPYQRRPLQNQQMPQEEEKEASENTYVETKIEPAVLEEAVLEEIPSFDQPTADNEPKREQTIAPKPVSQEPKKQKEAPVAPFALPFEMDSVVIPGTKEAKVRSSSTIKPPKADPFDMPPIHFSKSPSAAGKKEAAEQSFVEKLPIEEPPVEAPLASAKPEAVQSPVTESILEEKEYDLSYTEQPDSYVKNQEAVPFQEVVAASEKKEMAEEKKASANTDTTERLNHIFSSVSKKKDYHLDDDDSLENDIDLKLAALTGMSSRREKILAKENEAPASKPLASSAMPFGNTKSSVSSVKADMQRQWTNNRPAQEEEEEEVPARKSGKKEKTFSKLIKMLGPYTLLMMLSLFVTLLAVGLQLYTPFLTGKIIDHAIAEGNVNMSAVGKLLIQMLVVVLVTVIAQWVMEVLNNRITFSVIKDIRTKTFQRIMKLPLGYIDSKTQGEMINSVMTDVDQISDGLLLGFSQIFSGIITIVGTLVFMVIIDWRVTIAVVVLTPLSLVVASQIAKRTFHMFQKQSADRAELASHIEEMISNQQVVIAFGHEAISMEEFDDLNTEMSKSSRKATFFSSITNPSTRFVNGVVYAVVGVLGAVFGIQKTITVGGISCFLSYAKQYTKPFNEISGVIAEFQNALASAARVFAILDQEEEKEDNAAKPMKGCEGSVELSHVKFSYSPSKPLITDFNLNVAPGQRIAIVGPTGCGKTTLINLLMRFYDVKAGIISVDRKNIYKVTRDSLRDNFGMVLQDTWIRSGTIEENIAIGNPDATHEQIVAAAEAVHAHSFIRRLPNGYQTVVTEGGGNLSQGQKQLLCIARVMLKRPPMLILDEATSSIDSRTEIKVQKAFDKLMEGRTSFVVAHRLSTIREADVILVMKNGNIIEQGSHDELLRKGGFYYELFQSQYAH